jgi:hypothetical protein
MILARPLADYFDHDRKEQSCQGVIGVPLFTNCREEVFSETRLPVYGVLALILLIL